MKKKPINPTIKDMTIKALWTLNHSPLGSAGLMNNAKCMPVRAMIGHATHINMPWSLVKAGRTRSIVNLAMPPEGLTRLGETWGVNLTPNP